MKLINTLLILLLVTGINGAYGAEYPEIRQPYTENNLTVRRDVIEDCDRTISESKAIIDSLMEKLKECQDGRRKEFEAYQRILRDNGLLPPEKK